MSIDADKKAADSPRKANEQPARPLPPRVGAAAGETPQPHHSTSTPGEDMSPRATSVGGRIAQMVRTMNDWIAANTFFPPWVPPQFRAPVFGYFVAALLQVLAVMVVLLLTKAFGSFAFIGAPALFFIALAALNWGAAPAVAATLLGGLLIYYAILPPQFSLPMLGGREASELLIFFATGIAISILASQTERQRRAANAAAERLTAERVRLDAIIEAAPDMISIHNANGEIVRLNRAGQNMLSGADGHVTPATSSDDPLSATSGSTQPLDALLVARALTGEAIQRQEISAIHGPGDDRVLEVSAAPFRDAWGAIVGAVAIARDVTKQRRLEHEVAERAGQLEATFDALVDGVVVYGADGAILRLNAAARSNFERTAPPELHGRPFEERSRTVQVLDDQGRSIPPAEWPSARILRGETLSGLAAAEMRFLMADNTELWLSVTGGPVRGPDGTILGAVAVHHDVTARRQLERRTYDALLALLTVATTLVEAPDETRPEGERLVAQRLLDLTQRVLGCERVALTTLDSRTDAMHPLAVAGLSPEQERQWWAEQAEIERRGVRFSDGPDQDAVARLRAGEVMTFDLTKSPYNATPNPFGVRTVLAAPMTAGGEMVGLITYDYGGADHAYTPSELALAAAVARLAALIIERERLLREREEARASAIALRQANERMDEFLGIASHELKTPLTTIKANVQLSLRRLDRLDVDAPDLETELRRILPAKGLLNRAGRQVDRLDRLVGDLLDVSRIRAGKLELRPEEADLAAVVRDAVQEQRQSWPRRSISLSLPKGAAAAVIDPDRIGQVVTNLLTNALKYSSDEEPVAVSLARQGDVWRVAVRDRGPGIPAAELPHIWERFHRVPGIEVQSGSGVGLGLGLHISKNIVERQGGAVGVGSVMGAGSEFWFTSPVATSDVATGAEQPEP